VAATFAVMTHLAILGLFSFTTPRFLPDTREERAISLDIVESLQVPRPAESPPRAPQPKDAFSGPSSPEAPQAHEASPPQPPTAPSPIQVPSKSAGAIDSAALGKALRGSVVGCAHADMANLTDAERQHCRDTFAASRADTPDLSRFAIAPEKRAIFDAAWTADHSPEHMAGIACLARFGGHKLEWLHPSQGVKLGPLPCYVFTPKATFSADPPHAPGW
jgi:hypothetical protein